MPAPSQAAAEPSQATAGAEPQQRLAPAAKSLWRLTAALGLLPALLVAGIIADGLTATGTSGVAVWGPYALAFLLVAAGVAFLPALRYRRWRYAIRDDEIDIRHGALSIRRTLVPMTRVQHVETRTGPLQSMFGLSTVIFHTAAGQNSIPELSEGEADDVRRRVGALAGTSTDDV